ncbi:Thioredoxin domain-containing protein 3 homolog [Geodia barretti]|nr:Thioredoxin domain-containing protein 3 homolog [Geodia barretti]
MIIKPDAVKAGKVDEIIEQLKEQGLDVLAAEERQLSKEEAAEFYKQHEGTDYFEELLEFMSSGPCTTVVVTRGETGEGVVEEVRQLMGPADVDLAKENSPESLRAKFGTSARENAVHGSDSHETAARELAFFFPRLKIPWVPGTAPPIQRTLALIRPDCLAKHRDEMLEKVQEAGFEIAMQKELTLTREQAAEFYKEHEGKEYFESLCNTMSSGPMLALCLAREDAVSGWRDKLGPTELQEAKETQPECLRSMFSEEDAAHNPLHGSATLEEAEKELQYFFPKEKTLAIIKPNAIDSRVAIIEKIKEAGFNISLSKETTLTKEMAEQLYSEHKGKDFFEDLTGLMSNGPSLFMVLSREDAVSGWRALMGPLDPEEAKKENPNSIRALFGESMLANAVHGSSTAEKAQKVIQTFIGEVPEEEEEGGEGGEGATENGADGEDT